MTDKGEHGSDAHGLQQGDRPLLAGAQASRQRDAPDSPAQHAKPGRDGRRGRVRIRLSVHDREQPRMGHSERDVGVPAAAKLLHWVGMRLARGLLRDVAGQAMLGDRIEQPALVTEQAVDGGRLNGCRSRDRARRRGIRTAGGDQRGGRGDDAGANVVRVSVGAWVRLVHESGIRLDLSNDSDN